MVPPCSTGTSLRPKPPPPLKIGQAQTRPRAVRSGSSISSPSSFASSSSAGSHAARATPGRRHGGWSWRASPRIRRPARPASKPRSKPRGRLRMDADGVAAVMAFHGLSRGPGAHTRAAATDSGHRSLPWTQIRRPSAACPRASTRGCIACLSAFQIFLYRQSHGTCGMTPVQRCRTRSHRRPARADCAAWQKPQPKPMHREQRTGPRRPARADCAAWQKPQPKPHAP